MYIKPEHRPRAIYVSNLPSEFTHDELVAKFSQFGSLHDLQVFEKPSFEFGYDFYVVITYYNKLAADAAVFEAQCSNFKGSTIKVTHKLNPKKINPACMLSIENLDYAITERQLYNKFKACGQIFSLKIHGDHKHANIGTAEIQFYKLADAAKAYNELHNEVLGSRKMRVISEYDLNEMVEAKSYAKNSTEYLDDDDAMSTASQSVFEEEFKDNKETTYNIPATLSKVKAAWDRKEYIPCSVLREVFGILMLQKVKKVVGKLSKAQKITGMMVDLELLEADDVILLLENDEAFAETLEHAQQLLAGIWWE
jgi:RNA recognition motif-containing protein